MILVKFFVSYFLNRVPSAQDEVKNSRETFEDFILWSKFITHGFCFIARCGLQQKTISSEILLWKLKEDILGKYLCTYTILSRTLTFPFPSCSWKKEWNIIHEKCCINTLLYHGSPNFLPFPLFDSTDPFIRLSAPLCSLFTSGESGKLEKDGIIVKVYFQNELYENEMEMHKWILKC